MRLNSNTHEKLFFQQYAIGNQIIQEGNVMTTISKLFCICQKATFIVDYPEVSFFPSMAMELESCCSRMTIIGNFVTKLEKMVQ